MVCQFDQALLPSQIGRAFLCGIGIALDFTKRDGGFGKFAVFVENGIVRIFPALLYEPGARMASIFQEAVAIAIAIMIHPIEGPLDIAPNRTDEIQVAGAFVVSHGKHDEERSGIHTAVITAKRDLLGGSHLAFPQFVKNFSGLGVLLGYHAVCLCLGQKLQNTLGQSRLGPQHLISGDQAVAAKYRIEPGHAGIRVLAFRIA